MTKDTDLILAICAFAFYIVGGLATFAGLGLFFFFGGEDVLGWGSGKALGYLSISVGLCLSILGVLFMRIIRNRTPR
ncbi:hypothetical protein [Trichloromonas sp.]|uniref:hypothetical protein n=1 Tax=Trichloromonas sp. TaxID=3069249 RepID=UPI002A4DD023|nr:hypothetical protein [Trichloromonas sp.]